ncbi:MAG: DUF924 domain-containing protein [Albidovulum sp.]|nr:DUF924 domain-containing protein [Albidovulum sp.]MDE0304144.1 DUF924 domain-containing protein [Albidovulum sp.]MDE0533458.1 DUF924 domain-containing protein [Albidovulum sp.]
MSKFTPEAVLSFWVDDIGPKGWYFGGDKIDAKIRKRFRPLWDALMSDEYSDWGLSPKGALARIIVLDQFSRNMFRDSAKSFEADERALRFAGMAIQAGHDMEIPEPERQFFYLPYMHSEDLDVQDQCVRLFESNTNNAENLLHAKAHREVIARFGRFPYRNEALGRESSVEEADWMAQGGYKSVVDSVRG